MRLAASLGLAGLLLVPGALDARQHHPARGHRILPAAAALDPFTQPAGAYSFRKLKSNYAGSAVKLRRTTGGTQDIGFTAGGDFDTAAATTFCAATTCFIDTWYDQSGNAQPLVQATAGSQPGLIFNCIGDKPCARFVNGATNGWMQSGTSLLASVVSSFSAVHKRSGGTGLCINAMQNSGAPTPNRIAGRSGAAGVTLQGNTGTVSNAASDDAWHATSAVLNGVSSVVASDGVETTGTATGATTAGFYNVSGALPVTTVCDQTEAVIWNGYALTAAERIALNDNQRNYYMPYTLDAFAAPSAAYSFRKLKSTYTGPGIRIRRASDNAETDIGFLGFVPGLGSPIDVAAANAHCAATTCFIRTFYDQSGNARDLIQATAGSQPQLVLDCKQGLPCVALPGALSMASVGTVTPTSPVTSSAVAQRVAFSGGYCVFKLANNQLVIDGSGANTWAVYGGTEAMVNFTADGTWHAALGIIAGAASSLAFDGLAPATGTVTMGAAAGAMSVTGGENCRLAEWVAWNGYAFTAGEKAALPANQKSFWGTP